MENYPDRLRHVLNQARNWPDATMRTKLLSMTIDKIRARMATSEMSESDKLECERILNEAEHDMS